MVKKEFEYDLMCANVEESAISCGVKQISGVAEIISKQDAEDFLFDCIRTNGNEWNTSYILIDNNIYPFYLFSDTVDSGGGKYLSKFIIDNELGTIYESKSRENPNTGNNIQVFIWSPNKKNLTSWWKKQVKHLGI